MKREWKIVEKRLKNTRNMNFVFREIHTETPNFFRDHFLHKIQNIKLIRETGYRVKWFCPELGSGTASLKYWINLKVCHNRHDCKECK